MSPTQDKSRLNYLQLVCGHFASEVQKSYNVFPSHLQVEFAPILNPAQNLPSLRLVCESRLPSSAKTSAASSNTKGCT